MGEVNAPTGVEIITKGTEHTGTAQLPWHRVLSADSVSTDAITAANELTFANWETTYTGAFFQPTHNWITIRAYGTDAEDEDAQMVIKGWRPWAEGDTPYMVGRTLWDGVVTLGAQTFTYNGTTYYWADTMDITSGGDYTSDPPGAQVLGPGSDDAVELVFDGTGYTAFTVEFDKNAGSTESASMNALWSEF